MNVLLTDDGRAYHGSLGGVNDHREFMKKIVNIRGETGHTHYDCVKALCNARGDEEAARKALGPLRS